MHITGNASTELIKSIMFASNQIHAVEKIFQTFPVPPEDEGKVGIINSGFLKNSSNFILLQLRYYLSVVNLHDGPSR